MAIPNDIQSLKNLLPEITIDGVTQIDYWNAWRVATEYVSSTKLLDEYVVEEGISWHDISEVVYEDRELWWVIPLFNEIEDPFLMFSSSNLQLKERKLKVLKPKHLNQFLNEIRSFRVKKEQEL